MSSGYGRGTVGYNVQTAVDTKHHLIVAHEVTNDVVDRSQLANIAMKSKQVLQVDNLTVIADREYYKGEEIKACEDNNITTYLPKTQTSNNQIIKPKVYLVDIILYITLIKMNIFVLQVTL